MEKIILGVLTLAAYFCAFVAAVPGYAPLYRYYNGEHFYTTSIEEIGTAVPGQQGKYGYRSEGIQCVIATEPRPGFLPLYRYWNGNIPDHFYTTNASEIGTTVPGATGKYGYRFESTAAYCSATYQSGLVPLYRYYNGNIGDHFYTTNAQEIGTTVPGVTGKYGYKSEGVACYVFQYGSVVQQ